MKKSLRNYIKKWYVITGIIVLVIISIAIFLSGNKNPQFDTAVINIADVTEEVSVTGKVMPIDKAELSFEKGGVVKKIYVKVGDKVKKGSVLASLESSGDEAALASAVAKFQEVSRSLRPEERIAEQSRVDSAKTAFDNAVKNIEIANRESYNKAQSALINYTDQFFNNPQSVNPSINIFVELTKNKIAINSSRLLVTDMMNNWKKDIDSGHSIDSATILANTKRYLDTIKNFMSQLSIRVNDQTTGNSGQTQEVLDAQISSMNSGVATLNQAISIITDAETLLRNAEAAYVEAENNFSFKNAGSSSETIKAQSAAVDSYRAELSKNRIISPIDGIITKIVPNEGEYVSPTVPSINVQTDGVYKIEANVPEADIAKVQIGNTAKITLDAYGSDTFFYANVVYIDPAETILEGVPTYKVTLHFSAEDPRIRSGMTANTDILTKERKGVIAVPSRAIVDNKNENSGISSKSVRLINADGKGYMLVPVNLGLKGSSGYTEVISGINVGDKVVTYLK